MAELEGEKLLHLFKTNFDLSTASLSKLAEEQREVMRNLEQERQAFSETRRLLEEMISSLDALTTRQVKATAAQIEVVRHLTEYSDQLKHQIQLQNRKLN